MHKSLTESLISSSPTIKPGKIACATEIARLYRENDPDRMKSFVRAFQDFWVGRNNMPEFEGGLRQGALRNLDQASYMADLIVSGDNPRDALGRTAAELGGVPQHLWTYGRVRNFYHASTGYLVPFGVEGFHTILDNSVYGKDLNDEARLWLLVSRFTHSEDAAINYLKNKILELDDLIGKIAEKSKSKGPASNETTARLELSGLTRLEKELLLLDDTTRRKIVAGYEDCLAEIRKRIIIPKEPQEYINVRLGILPKGALDGFRPKLKNSRWYDVTLRTLGLQGTPRWEEAVPFNQLADHDVNVKMERLPADLGWDVHQAVKNTYSFFSNARDFARLDSDQNLVPQQFLIGPVKSLKNVLRKEDKSDKQN